MRSLDNQLANRRRARLKLFRQYRDDLVRQAFNDAGLPVIQGQLGKARIQKRVELGIGYWSEAIDNRGSKRTNCIESRHGLLDISGVANQHCGEFPA